MNQGSVAQDGRWEDPQLFNIAVQSLSGRRAFGCFTSDPGIFKSLMRDDSVVSALASNPHLARETEFFKDFIQAAVSDYLVRFALSRNSLLPAELVESMAAAPESSVRSAVANRPELSEQALTVLVRDENPNVRESVTRNPNLTAELLELLAKDENSDVRRGAGSHPSIAVEVLEALATSHDATVRSGAARNPNLPEELIVALLHDEDSSVRLWAARNTSLTVGVLTELAAGDDLTLRAEVGGNPSTPLEVLETLAGDSNWRVRQAVARNGRTPATILAKLSEDSNFLVRQAMASNPDLPPEIIERLAGDRAWGVRGLIAGNPSCPPGVLASLASDVYPDVPVDVLSNPNTPIAAFRRILEDWAEESQAEARAPGTTGTDSPGAGSGLLVETSIPLWPKLTPDARQAIVPTDVDSLESMWRDYFESWSTDGSFEDHGPFEPLELATELNVPGAAELLDRVQEFDISDDVEDTRERFAEVADEFAEWVTSYLPIVPPEFNVSGSFWLENTEENRQKLRSMDAHHIWSVIWGDVLYLTEGFVDSDDDGSVTDFCVTDQPHISDYSHVCDLAVRITCLLCDGEGYSSEGEACPACEEGGQAVVDVEHFAVQRLAGLIPQSLKEITGWLW